jgi:hypothetical protein
MGKRISPWMLALGIAHFGMVVVWLRVVLEGFFGDHQIILGALDLRIPLWVALPFLFLAGSAAGGALGFLRGDRLGLFAAAAHAGAVLLVFLPVAFVYPQVGIPFVALGALTLGTIAFSQDVREAVRG